MGVHFSLYRVPAYPSYDGYHEVEIKHLLPNPERYAWSPGDWPRPQWFQCVMDNLGLETDFDYESIFTIHAPPEGGDGFFFLQDWSAMLDTARRYHSQAEEYRELLVDDAGQDQSHAIFYYLQCVIVTAEYVLAQERPSEFYIAWC